MSEPYFDAVLKEVNSVLEKLRHGLQAGAVPTREELEKMTWKTGRQLRLAVKPDSSKDRAIFWSEIKSWLKKVIKWEAFNPGVFSAASIEKEMIETDLLNSLERLLKYVKERKEGKVKAPKEPLVKRQKVKASAEEEKKKADEEWKEWEAKAAKDKRKEDAERWAKWDDDEGEGEGGKKWDEEDSDPDEPCPDKAKFGDCSYGRQCAFCK
mmetsp:Transcript_72429/g.200853  ORF Transcript_72429/g.200853 Transcript_72429/m.200853 type:complete len:210 (+) Transcript_72429:101-730(+)